MFTAAEVPHEEIRAEVERILSSPQFKASKRLKSFLRFVVDESLSGRAAALKGYTIAVSVFGRGEDFDARIDPIVSVEAGRLRKSLEYYYLTDGKSSPLQINIPKGTYVPTFVRQGTSPSARGPADDQLSDQHVSDKHSPYRSSGPGVAVFVFDSLTEGDKNDFFATGMSVQLVANLAQFKDFFIVGPLQQEHLEKTNLELKAIGTTYDVQFVLSGTVLQRGDSIKVIATLLDVESAGNVWVKQFDRDLGVSSLYEIEDEITREVAATLADRIGMVTRVLLRGTARKACHELTSFEAALKMYHWGIVMTDDAFNDAWHSLLHAVEKEPNFALTKALLADVYASDYLSEIGLVSDRLANAEKLAREAVDLDPDSPDARWVMGFVYFLQRRPEHFVEEFEAALALNPNNAMIMAIFGLFLPGLGQWDKALRLIETARKLNPHLSSQYHIPACLYYYRQGDYQRAFAESLLIRTPGLLWEPLIQAAILGQLGRSDEARLRLDKLLERQPEFREQGRNIVKRLLYSADLVESIFEGLHKAGFQSDSTNRLGAA